MDGPRVERESVGGACTACGSTAVQRYPAVSEGGWFMTSKCQDCLHSQSRERWNRLGYIVRLEDIL